MGVFNTRPRFQDRDIRQLSGDTISLSGETNINGVFRVVPGAVTGYVLKSLDNYGTVVWQPVSVSADTNTFTTGATLNGTVLEFDRNDLSNAYNVDLNPLIFTGNTSGDCINDIFVKNIHSCLPLNINPLDEGNVYFGSTSGVTIDVINSRLGIGNNTPSERLHISGGDMLVENTNGKFITDIQNTAGAPLVLLSGGTNGITRFGVIVPTFDAITMGIRGGSDLSYPDYGKNGDAFVRSSNPNNGLNIISEGGAGTDDYIRFYAGQNASPGNTPDLYIQGSGNTRGNVGIGTASPSEILHVEGNTKINGTLNISTLGTGTTISNLGIDSNGFVVFGTTGDTDTNTFTTGATLSGNVIEFDRNDLSNAYSVDLNPILSGLTGGNIYNTDGVITNDRTVSMEDTLLTFDGGLTGSSFFIITAPLLEATFTNGNILFEVDAGTLNNYFNFDDTISNLGFINPLNNQFIGISTTSTQMFVGTDLSGLTGFTGVEYVGDYSANFVNRSLVDKEYVDNLISSGVFTGLTISNISTGTSVSILGITSGGTIINGSDLYGEICDYCSNTVSGDVIISSGTTETDDINSDGNTIGSQSPFNCTLWCVYKGGEQVDSTSDFEVASQYQLGGFTLRCCDTNSLDGGTNYGTPISGETTTSGDTAPNVVSGITRPISVRQSKKIFLRNTHKSDILNSNQVSIVDSTLGRIELSTLSSIITSFNSKIYNSNLSTILSSENGFITNSSNSNIIGSQYSTLSGVTGSTIIGGNNITGTENDTVYVPKLNIDTLGVGSSINNLGIDVNGNVVVGGAGGGIPEATTATTTNINFTGQTIYFDAVTPGTGNITNTLTGAKLGLIQKIYHNDATEPTYPVGWVLMGDAIYFVSTLNVIYAEWAGGTRVEYWYVQEQ